MVKVAGERGGGGPSSVYTGPQPIPLRPVSDRVPHDWSQYSLEQIWGMVGRQSAATGQVTTDMWRSIMTLCRDKASQIEQALVRLRAYWPETQESARTFQTWGYSLVAALRCTAETAKLNLQVATNIKGELEAAKSRVAQLMALRDEYRLRDQQRQPTDLQHFAPLDWRPELDFLAREVMADLEQKIYTYALDLHADPPYQPTLDLIHGPTGTRGKEPTGTATPWSGGSGFVPPSWSTDRWESAPAPSSPRPDGTLEPDGVAMPDGETVLGGGIAPGGAGGAGLPPSGLVGSVDGPAGRVLGPGGAIGGPGGGPGTPGVGSGVPGSGGGIAVTPGAGGRPAGGPGMVPFVPPMAGQPGSRGTTGSAVGRRGRRIGGPSAFQVPAAPPAVIRPPEEPEHDPGPGVIGIDR